MTPPPPPGAVDPLADVLDRALRAVVPADDTMATLDAITARRRARRARIRRRRAAALLAVAATGAAACLAVLVTLDRAGIDRVDSVEHAASDPTTTAAADASSPPPPADTGERSPLAEDVVLKGQLGPTLPVPGEGGRIVSLDAGPTGWWIARGDPLDAASPVVSTLTHVAPDGTLGAIAEVHGVPLMAASDGDHLWVVSEDRVRSSTDDTRYRLKEIDPASGQVELSVALAESSAALGVRADGDEVRVVHADATSVLDPTTRTVEVLSGVPDAAPDTSRILFTGRARWLERHAATEVAAVWNDLPGSGSFVSVPGLHPLVAAGPWADGAAAAAVDTAVGVDLVELTPPPRAAPDGPPSLRTRLNGLPTGTELLAVGDDRVWLLVGTSVVAMALD